MRHLILLASLAGFAVFLPGIDNPLLRADETLKDGATKPEFLSLTIRVITADGEPIEGAYIRPVGLRTRIERGSHYGWNPESHGSGDEVVTDGEGQVEIKYPKYVTERLETGEVTLHMEHENFNALNEDAHVNNEIVGFTMTRGRRYSLKAVDNETGEPIRDHLHCQLSGSGSDNEWALQADGTLRSRAVALERNFLRVIYLPDVGPAKFSPPIFLGDQPPEILESRLPNVMVEPGMEIHGMLDDTVPRPVKNGHVVLKAVNTISGDQRDSQVLWADWVPVDAAGRFHFDSVPRNSIVMVVAVCDGFFSAAAIPEELDAAEITGEDAKSFLAHGSQNLPLVARMNENLDDWTLPMLATAKCRVTIEDPDGKPLPGAEVSAWPNQHFPGIGSNVIGSGYRSAKLLKLDTNQRKHRWWAVERREEMKRLGVHIDFSEAYMQSTDVNGIAMLHTLPGGRDVVVKQEIHVEHPEFEQPIAPDAPLRRYTQVELLAEDIAEVMIRMQRKGTETVGKR